MDFECSAVPKKALFDWTPTKAIDPKDLDENLCPRCCKVLSQKEIETVDARLEGRKKKLEERHERKKLFLSARQQIFDHTKLYDRGMFGIEQNEVETWTTKKFQVALGFAMANAMVKDIRLCDIPDGLCAYTLALVRTDSKQFHALLSKHGVDKAQKPTAASESGIDEDEAIRDGIIRSRLQADPTAEQEYDET